MKFNKLILFIICLVCSPFWASAEAVEMADVMRSNGKIYVVVAVVVTILIGILIFIFQTEKKLGKLEKEIDSLKEEK